MASLTVVHFENVQSLLSLELLFVFIVSQKSRHTSTKSAHVGLIAPPRAKGDKRPTRKKKGRNSGKGMHKAALSASFNNVFALGAGILTIIIIHIR